MRQIQSTYVNAKESGISRIIPPAIPTEGRYVWVGASSRSLCATATEHFPHLASGLEENNKAAHATRIRTRIKKSWHCSRVNNAKLRKSESVSRAKEIFWRMLMKCAREGAHLCCGRTDGSRLVWKMRNITRLFSRFADNYFTPWNAVLTQPRKV